MFDVYAANVQRRLPEEEKGAGAHPLHKYKEVFQLDTENIDIMNATEAELAAFFRKHPGHAELLRVTQGLDEETVAAVTCMAIAYAHGATDAEALEIFNKALAFYGRKPVTTGPKING